MGKMKNLYIDIINGYKYRHASEAERKKILEEWQETDEYKSKLNQAKNKSDEA